MYFLWVILCVGVHMYMCAQTCEGQRTTSIVILQMTSTYFLPTQFLYYSLVIILLIVYDVFHATETHVVENESIYPSSY